MKSKKPPATLNQESLVIAAKSLALMDKDFARTLAILGPPPLWERVPGFETLIRIILEQQVSLASADAMFGRLKMNIRPLTPAAVIAAGERFLRSFGVTRQKAAYFMNVAHALQNGELDLEALGQESDTAVLEKLTSVKGIGQWSAKIYLLMALCRPDIWPVGDVALATAFKNLKGRSERPAQAELNEIAKAWSPHRATAARMLWHYYLSGMQDGGGNQR